MPISRPHFSPVRTGFGRSMFLGTVAVLAVAASARADEIVLQDPQTCERRVVKAEEVGAETWIKVPYKEKARSPFKEVPTAEVVEIKRTSKDPQAGRLVEAIDDMLATPEAQEPIPLRHPNVLFEYADSDLESRSVGQKQLLRMGPENAAAIKTKLREIRNEVTNHAPPG